MGSCAARLPILLLALPFALLLLLLLLLLLHFHPDFRVVQLILLTRSLHVKTTSAKRFRINLRC